MLMFIGGCACRFLVLFLGALWTSPTSTSSPSPRHVATMTVPAWPGEGEWLVFRGGPSAAQNHRASEPPGATTLVGVLPAMARPAILIVARQLVQLLREILSVDGENHASPP